MHTYTHARAHTYTHIHKHTDTQTHIHTSDTPAHQHVPPCPQLAALMSSWSSPTCTIPIPYHCLPTPLPSYIRVPASLHPSSPHTITTPHHNRHMALPPHTITILHHRCLHPHHPYVHPLPTLLPPVILATSHHYPALQNSLLSSSALTAL